MPIVEIVVLVLPVTAVGAYYYNYKRICIFTGSLFLGVLTYFLIGILIARILGVGRFYSVPFGGFHISRDWALIMSALFWVVSWAVIISGILRVLDRSGHRGKGNHLETSHVGQMRNLGHAARRRCRISNCFPSRFFPALWSTDHCGRRVRSPHDLISHRDGRCWIDGSILGAIRGEEARGERLCP